MTDWKGNEIKPGMEVCFIKVVDRQMFRFGVLEPVVPGVAHIENWEDNKPDKPCWEVVKCYKVEGDSLLVMDEEGIAKLVQPLEIKCKWMDMETHILAIKGISDTKPE